MVSKTKAFSSVMLISMLLTPNLSVFLATSRQDQTQGDDLTITLAKVVKARDQVRGYVLDLKDKYRDKPQSAELLEGKKKYRTALGSYNGWVVAVKSAIRDGKAKDIQKNASYRKLGDEAGQAAREFITYAESKTGESKGVFVVFTGLVDIGLKIWNGYKDRQDKDRKARADAFETDTKWSQWEDIK
jgi:hypothetical protein